MTHREPIDPARPNRKHKIYTAGPISPNPMGDTAEFCSVAIDIAMKLRIKGWSVYCPHSNPLIDGWGLDDYLSEDFEWIDASNAICVLPFWEYSPGTKREIQHCMDEGIQIVSYRLLLPEIGVLEAQPTWVGRGR